MTLIIKSEDTEALRLLKMWSQYYC